MPRYFFNLYNDVIAIDEEGVELADLAAARAHGIHETRTMAAESARKGHLNVHHRIDIADETGTVVDTITFGDAVTINGL